MEAMTLSPLASAPAAGAYYCSTSGTTFSDKEAYLEHMKSDFHRYNLKRKVAGLPPVTKDWFEARRAQLSASAPSSSSNAKVWIDPLTKKKFMTENTYLAHTRSKKFLELLKRSGEPIPAPIIIARAEAEHSAPQTGTATPACFKAAYKSVQPALLEEAGEEEGSQDGSGWETASDVDAGEVASVADEGGKITGQAEMPEEWEEWDTCRCLFDNNSSADMDANLEYMFRKFGFYFPDAEYLKDPEGLLKYLGAKLQYGHVALYARGDDASAKQFRSLHAVQRHMVDSNQCRMVYDDDEDEYEQFYDYGGDEESMTGKELAQSDAPASAMVLGGYELMLPNASGQGSKVLGTREFARYYRQSHRPEDQRQSVVVNTMLARYRNLGITLTNGFKSLEEKKMTSKTVKDYKWEGKREVRRLEFSNFVKNLGKGIGREY